MPAFISPSSNSTFALSSKPVTPLFGAGAGRRATQATVRPLPPFIFLTALSDRDNELRARRLGAISSQSPSILTFRK
jgi:hypothetical protein